MQRLWNAYSETLTLTLTFTFTPTLTLTLAIRLTFSATISNATKSNCSHMMIVVCPPIVMALAGTLAGYTG